MRRGAIVLLLLAAGCRDEPDPVDVPFSALPVTDRPPPPVLEPLAESSASSSVAVPAPRRQPVEAGGGIDGCCGALAAVANSAKDGGKRAVYRQAQLVCDRNAQRVRNGQLTRSQALGQVRSSLLGEAPASCR